MRKRRVLAKVIPCVLAQQATLQPAEEYSDSLNIIKPMALGFMGGGHKTHLLGNLH